MHSRSSCYCHNQTRGAVEWVSRGFHFTLRASTCHEMDEEQPDPLQAGTKSLQVTIVHYHILIIINSIVDFLCSFSRYAVKLLYDEAILGEASDSSELVEYLTEYDREWYIGCEEESDWRVHILDRKPHLFSLGSDQQNVEFL